jgi:hypothetical protein
MTEIPNRVQDEIAALRTLRDELRVRVSLAAMDARDLWQDAEHKWTEIEAKLEELGRVSAASGREIGAALQLLSGSVRNAYLALKTRI